MQLFQRISAGLVCSVPRNIPDTNSAYIHANCPDDLHKDENEVLKLLVRGLADPSPLKDSTENKSY